MPIFLKNAEEALRSFDRAIDLEPDDALAWINRGTVLGELKKYEDSLGALDKAIDLEPDNTLAWIIKGEILGEFKKYEEALEIIKKAIEIEPDNTLSWIVKGNILTEFNKYEEALRTFDKVIDIEPDNGYAWVGKSRIFFSLELYDRALEASIKATSIIPNLDYVWLNKALIHRETKKYAELRESLKKAFNINPYSTSTNNLFAEYYLTFGDLKNASIHVEKALVIDKENALSLGLRGKINIEEQDYVKSSEYFKRATSSDLRNPIYLLWDSYARYLNAELKFTSNEQMYQDIILAIIRDLEKVNAYVSYENKSYLRIIPGWLKRLIVLFIKVIMKIFIYFSESKNLRLRLLDKTNVDKSEKLIVSLLHKMKLVLISLESPKIVAYNYYFLGCFYYKINDYFTAVDYLKKCKNLNPDSYMKKSACQIINSVWNNKMRPSIWDW